MEYDGICVEIKCIEQKYPANKSKMYWLKAIVVLRNTM